MNEEVTLKPDLNSIANSRGGECLGPSRPDHYYKKYLWRCDKGHTWEAREDSIIGGSWCPICVHINQKKTIEEMRELAHSHGGECLSPNYINCHTKLRWKCSEKHIFEINPIQNKTRAMAQRMR